MKTKKIGEGKSKKVYETDNEGQVVLVFKDDLILRNGTKASIPNKGAINNSIATFLFRMLESYHVPTHYVKQLSNREMLVKKLAMIPVTVFVRNIAAGSLVEQFGIDEGKELECPIIEYYLKGEDEKETMINEDHLVSFGHASPEDLKEIHRLSSKINAILKEMLRRRGLGLIDFKLEFGRRDSHVFLGDEISADTCYLWDITGETKFNKRLTAKNTDDIAQEYQAIKKRIFLE
ncbi:phosphoribosylaminoimidazolesuccinocarboxamide synthase [candidate division KSB1 bacterium]|nr:phosphoribosylaminoimidazolesuccinocarboxamide synthase [candidate division KSB1 bacterium]